MGVIGMSGEPVLSNERATSPWYYLKTCFRGLIWEAAYDPPGAVQHSSSFGRMAAIVGVPDTSVSLIVRSSHQIYIAVPTYNLPISRSFKIIRKLQNL